MKKVGWDISSGSADLVQGASWPQRVVNYASPTNRQVKRQVPRQCCCNRKIQTREQQFLLSVAKLPKTKQADCFAVPCEAFLRAGRNLV